MKRTLNRNRPQLSGREAGERAAQAPHWRARNAHNAHICNTIAISYTYAQNPFKNLNKQRELQAWHWAIEAKLAYRGRRWSREHRTP